MKIVKTINELNDALSALSQEDSTLGFVPTMGALHEGHISLVKRCRDENDIVIVSVFVNPTQFNDKNDLKNYPRTEEADCALLKDAGCDIVFIPSVEEIYPEQDTRIFDFGDIEKVMEGAHRPGHFNGVAQVVSKLFYITHPTNAYLGEKDFQQIAVIKSMVNMLNIDVNIVECDIKRAHDGLALSSRNMLLTPDQRSAAPVIYLTLKESLSRKEWCNVEELKKWVIEQIDSNNLLKVEYFDIVDSWTLQSINSWDDTCEKRGCIAVQVGSIRLIDNIKF